MPKQDDAPEMAVCDACGRLGEDVRLAHADGWWYCLTCAERRIDDPIVTVQGRALTVSELEMQAEDDKDLAAALEGDSVQDQIKAAKR